MKAYDPNSACRVVVVGLGLIGGSFAARLRQVRPAWTVVGCDVDPAALERASRGHLVAETAGDWREAVDGADLVVLAVPVLAILAILAELPHRLEGEAIVLDVGSTKGAIVAAMDSLPPRLQAVGGHPMTGARTAGVSGPSPALFEGKRFVLCPARTTGERTLAWARELVGALGAVLIEMSAAEHDLVVAIVSHLPYLLPLPLLGLYEEAGEAAQALAAGGFRARIQDAGANVPMWTDILTTNRDGIARALTLYRRQLEALETRIRTAGDAELRDMLARAAAAAAAIVDGA